MQNKKPPQTILIGARNWCFAAGMRTCMNVSMHACMHARMHVRMRARIHAYIRTCSSVCSVIIVFCRFRTLLLWQFILCCGVCLDRYPHRGVVWVWRLRPMRRFTKPFRQKRFFLVPSVPLLIGTVEKIMAQGHTAVHLCSALALFDGAKFLEIPACQRICERGPQQVHRLISKPWEYFGLLGHWGGSKNHGARPHGSPSLQRAGLVRDATFWGIPAYQRICEWGPQ